MEPGESIEECIQQEISEELGVPSVVHEHIKTVQHAYPHGLFTIEAYRVTLLGTVFSLKCHSEFSWVPIDGLCDINLPILESNVPIQLAIVAHEECQQCGSKTSRSQDK